MITSGGNKSLNGRLSSVGFLVEMMFGEESSFLDIIGVADVVVDSFVEFNGGSKSIYGFLTAGVGSLKLKMNGDLVVVDSVDVDCVVLTVVVTVGKIVDSRVVKGSLVVVVVVVVV